MIKELITHLKAYEVKRNEIDETFTKAKKNIDDTYNPASLQYQTQLDEATRIHIADVKEITEAVFDVVNSAFSTAKKKLKEYITEPIPAELKPMFDHVHGHGENMTKAELEVYEEKLFSNYTAKRVLSPVFEKVTGETKNFMLYDDISKQVNEAETTVNNWINNYDSTTYSHALLITDDENNILNECDNQIASFLNGEV